MNKKTMIAKELVKLAKTLIADYEVQEENFQYTNVNYPQFFLHADAHIEQNGKQNVNAKERIEKAIKYAIKNKLITVKPKIINVSTNDNYNLYHCHFTFEENNKDFPGMEAVDDFQQYLEHLGFSFNSDLGDW